MRFPLNTGVGLSPLRLLPGNATLHGIPLARMPEQAIVEKSAVGAVGASALIALGLAVGALSCFASGSKRQDQRSEDTSLERQEPDSVPGTSKAAASPEAPTAQKVNPKEGNRNSNPVRALWVITLDLYTFLEKLGRPMNMLLLLILLITNSIVPFWEVTGPWVPLIWLAWEGIRLVSYFYNLMTGQINHAKAEEIEELYGLSGTKDFLAADQK